MNKYFNKSGVEIDFSVSDAWSGLDSALYSSDIHMFKYLYINVL
jgi:hypothetical protein